jgi:hypothetical protein
VLVDSVPSAAERSVSPLVAMAKNAPTAGRSGTLFPLFLAGRLAHRGKVAGLDVVEEHAATARSLHRGAAEGASPIAPVPK